MGISVNGSSSLRDQATVTTSELLTFIAVLLAIPALYFGREVLIPLALAVVFSFVLSPLVNWLEGRHLPRFPAIVLVLALAFGVVGTLAWAVAGQLVQVTDQLP